MAGFITDKDRRVIPRWRTFENTLSLRELESSTVRPAHHREGADLLAPKMADWLKFRTVGHAADAVGAAIVLGRGVDVHDAAQFLLAEERGVSPWVKELAERVLNAPDDVAFLPVATDIATLKDRIRIYRHLLRTAAWDPITWVDLSHAYAGLGLARQAERSMTVGLQLGANNRFVLRSASRLWVHLDDPERAHDILQKAERTPYDPWLLAAEIAIGSIDRGKPMFVKAARQMLAEGRVAPLHISELAAAVATLELSSGSVKKSRRLFVRALEQPTENTIAQAAWAARQNQAIPLAEEYLTRPNTFEARSWSFYTQGRWKEVLKECQQWQYDQPFSSRPCGQGSYVAAVVLEDFEASQRFAQHGLIANPKDFTLLNNLAFAQINRGDLEGARKTLAGIGRLQLPDQDRAVLHATRGLWEYRGGDPERGRQLYLTARSEARKTGNQDGGMRLALASFFQAVEEGRRNSRYCESILADASEALQRVRDPVSGVLLQRLDRVKEKFGKSPRKK